MTFIMSAFCKFHQELILCALGLLCGSAVHLGFFIHGEWHVQAPQILLDHLWFFSCFAALSSYYKGTVLGDLSYSLLILFCGYLPGLLGSITIYRVFYHRLTTSGFRGPWYARITKLWHVWAARDCKNHLVLEKLHEQYGDFVRTGPSEITVFHPGVFMAVDGPRSECIKAEWYDILHPDRALVTTRAKPIHAARRREWNRGFSAHALVQHEAKILKYIEQLDMCIEADAKANIASEVRNLFFWFGFDVMGDFVFSKSFEMLHQKQWHHIIVRLQRALSLLGPFSPAPWLIQVGFKLCPRVSVLRDWFDMVAWCERQMRVRLDDGTPKPAVPDLAHYLMELEDGQPEQEDRLPWLFGDSLLAIVAGSEPTAAALIGIFCEIAKHPNHVDMIFEELADVEVTDLKALTRLPHLNAVINEGLRLYPALLTGGARKTTENGARIGDTFIPPYTTIIAPRHVISRRDDCFERPNEFIPERWTTRPEMVRNAAAFAPFGTGHHSCLGRFLATDTMRFVVARLLKKYRIRLAPGETGKRVFEEVKDQFTSNPGPLSLCFELR
ncbi:Tryprostatin B 6-hydroxylase 2 [Colletotrichum chlorophyti]|uniref:Tryprostatin B 6-hydroxylase 2 n=1 Tax=Colletotrichum chlorophyti TaxID=708187 RepID=A0A1Q8RLR2_9PEZI|nr:Tryprostatin B 6-hydroxylase 2 [Colletotrichum chlorophyti]